MSVLSYSNAPVPGSAFPPDDATDRTPVSRKWLWFWAAAVTLAYALLWSPHWYPLSDSSLFLSLGRAVADGRGMTIQGETVRKIPPATPLIIAAVIKLGGGVGALQALMTALTLGAHALTFLTLRRWVGERLALAATLAAAFSYWVFANAFTIMTEPPSLFFLWGGLLALTGVKIAADGRLDWRRYGLALGLLLLSAAGRDALLTLLPGFFVALYLANRNLPWRAHLPWALSAILLFTGWAAYRYPEKFARLVGIDLRQKRLPPAATAPATGPTTQGADEGAEPTPEPEHPAYDPEFDPEGSGGPVREGRYKFQLMFGVRRDFRHLITIPPVLAGRWLCEGLVAATSFFYDTTVKPREWTGNILGVIGCVVLIAGFGSMIARRQWWVLAPLLYFLSIWLQWGTRLKPRYMGLIAPMLFLVAAAGLVWLLRRAGAARFPRHALLRTVAYTMVALIIIGNAFPWYVEMRIRRQTARDFYDVARRGAYAQLVDIGGYLQQHARPDETVWLNVGAHRRIAHLLAGRQIAVNETYCNVPGDWKDGKSMRKLRLNIPDRYVIVYTDHPAPKTTWPTWHLPLTPQAKLPPWWRLFERTPNGWQQVKVPVNREYVRTIPKAST